MSYVILFAAHAEACMAFDELHNEGDLASYAAMTPRVGVTLSLAKAEATLLKWVQEQKAKDDQDLELDGKGEIVQLTMPDESLCFVVRVFGEADDCIGYGRIVQTRAIT